MGAQMASSQLRRLGRFPLAGMRAFIRVTDALLRRKDGIFEYNTAPECIFRANICRNPEFYLGPRVSRMHGPGKVLQLHFRSENIPPLPAGGPSIAYARQLNRIALASLKMLADYLLQNDAMKDVVLIGGITNMLFAGNVQAGSRIFTRLGVNMARHDSPENAFKRFLNDLYAWMLMWAFNPRILRARKPLENEWFSYWITREELVARYASSGLKTDADDSVRHQRRAQA